MPESDRIELVEDRIPLEGIRDTTLDLVELYGGEVESEAYQQITFTLPNRRGVAASGGVDCLIRWSADTPQDGTVTLSAAREADRPKPQQIAILSAGVAGAFLWLLWPFFPALGPAAWVGGLIAFASYFLTLRRSNAGIAGDLLQRLARIQRERQSVVSS